MKLALIALLLLAPSSALASTLTVDAIAGGELTMRHCLSLN